MSAATTTINRSLLQWWTNVDAYSVDMVRGLRFFEATVTFPTTAILDEEKEGSEREREREEGKIN